MFCKRQKRLLPVTFTLVLLSYFLLTAAPAQGQTFSVVYSFNPNSTDPNTFTYGSGPDFIAQGRDGNFYTTSFGGGEANGSGFGTVFSVTPGGVLSLLCSFVPQPPNNSGVCNPQGSLTLGTDGNFYGAAPGCGSNGLYGYVFKITPGGSLTYLYEFTGGSDGEVPLQSPLEGPDGNFYGTTSLLPPWTVPTTIYRITPSGKLTTIYPGAVSDGYIGLWFLGTDGNFYVTSSSNGFFKMTLNGKLKTIPTNCSPSICGSNLGGMIQASDGNIYGTMQSEGKYRGGTVFKLTTSGKMTVLHAFNPANNGFYGPYTGVIQATDGNLYGVVANGGANGDGAIYRISTNGHNYEIVHNFDSTVYGASNLLFQHTNGLLYGLANNGGQYNGGAFYSLNEGLAPFVSMGFPSGKVGATAEILGQALTGTSGVSFDGTPASYTVVSDTYLTATVPAGATTGTVTVTTPGGTRNSNKQFRVTPQIKSFSPPSGIVGTPVTITGVSLTQTTKVTFGGVAATSFAVNSDTQVTANVPAGAKTGKIAVTTPGGTATSTANFLVTPQILSFSPTSGPVGTPVQITGVSLSQTTQVTFGGVAATQFTVNSDTQVTANVPGAQTGYIGITTPGGTATSTQMFTVTQ